MAICVKWKLAEKMPQSDYTVGKSLGHFSKLVIDVEN